MGVCVPFPHSYSELANAFFSYLVLHQVANFLSIITSEELQSISYFTICGIPYGAALHGPHEIQSCSIAAPSFQSFANQPGDYALNLCAHQPIYVPGQICKYCRITVGALNFVITTVCKRYVGQWK